ncbi:hypothetical protein B0H14DRAFT_2695983 [Mycena olivaceomarginata]|nr:hypothetical protein B0H14DRAFT_2695983 [Mycena olivaceomarginata]
MSGQNGAPSGGLRPDVQAVIDISLGAVVISNYLSFLTMGVVGCYTWMYFRTFPDDRWVFKLLVSACFIMCLAIWVFDWAVTNYANPGVMAFTHWALPMEAMFMGTTGTLVQCFYAWRVWLVSTRKKSDPASTVCYIISVVATHKLVSAASSVRFREIIYRTVECNVLSTLAQAATIGLFQSHSVGLYFALPDMILAKIYTFSLIISLLGRRSNGTGLREQHALGDLRARNQNSGAAMEVAINVQRETAEDTAEDSMGWDKTNSDFDQVQKVRLPDV